MVSEDVVLDSARHHGLDPAKTVPCERFADFDEWAPGLDGERKVRLAVTENWAFFGNARELAVQWLFMKSAERNQATVLSALEGTRKAAEAAARSSRKALMVATVAAAGAVLSAIVVVVGLFSDLGPQLVKFEAAPASLKAEKALPSSNSGTR